LNFQSRAVARAWLAALTPHSFPFPPKKKPKIANRQPTTNNRHHRRHCNSVFFFKEPILSWLVIKLRSIQLLSSNNKKKKKMPKPKNKRQKLESFNMLSNLSGFDTTGGQESLDDCMAEFQQQQQQPASSTQDLNNKTQSTNAAETSKKRSAPPPPYKNRDQIESWNRSLLGWAAGGKYTPGLLPNIDQELARNFKVKELSCFLLSMGGDSGSIKSKDIDIRMPVFERWFLDSKWDERHVQKSSLEPLLPLASSPHSEPSQRLIQELCHHKQPKDAAERVVAELCRKTNTACQEILAQQERYAKQSPLKAGDRMDLEESSSTITLVYSRKKWKKPFLFKLNKVHYDRLLQRFLEIHNDQASSTQLEMATTKVKHAFHIIILALLLRYSALSGTTILQKEGRDFCLCTSTSLSTFFSIHLYRRAVASRFERRWYARCHS
jgi:hypothetical protein